MKKDIEWLKNEVNELPLRFLGFSMLKQQEEFAVSKDDVLELIDQLDEPEVLSQECIDKNKEPFHHFETNKVDYYVSADFLQNLLVPKQEEVKIESLWAEDIEEAKENGMTLFKTMDWMGIDSDEKEKQDLFARAWLNGYEVAEEQKYQVIIRDGEYMGLYLCKNHDIVTIGTNDSYIEKRPEVTYLTEQEIKDYDERFWPFAVKVEEMEE